MQKQRTDQVEIPAAGAPRDAQSWVQVLARYREPSVPRGVVEIAITVGPFVRLWVAMWLALGLQLLADAWRWRCRRRGFCSGCLLFCTIAGTARFSGTGSANDWVGRVCGVLTFTPFGVWRRTHNMHHATSGNLERRGIGDIETMTVNEYLAQPWWERLRYRAYRNPIVLFVIGPAYVFLIANRLPIGMMNVGWRPWFSTMANNAAIAAAVVFMMWLVGVGPFLMIELPIILLASSIGVWLFYVQHQFDDTVWTEGQEWNMQQAALAGCRTTICRRCCAGSPAISACITCIICRAGFRFTACAGC